MIDKNRIEQQRTYTDLNHHINEKIPGNTYAERILTLYNFYDRNYGKTTAELILQDLIKKEVQNATNHA